MSNYSPLQLWLRTFQGNRVSLSFSALESILGFALPASAKKYAAWWANERGRTSHVQCLSWLDAGFEVKNLNLSRQTITFQRSLPLLTLAQ
jgi:hypothetical protein